MESGGWKMFFYGRNRALPGWHELLASKESDSRTPLAKVDESKGRTHLYLNGLCPTTKIKCMVESKNSQAFEMLFSFVAVFIDRATGIQQSCSMMQAHFIYFKVLMGLKRRWKEGEVWAMHLADLLRQIDCFKKLVWEVLYAHYEQVLYTLNIYLLDYLVDDVDSLLDCSYRTALILSNLTCISRMCIDQHQKGIVPVWSRLQGIWKSVVCQIEVLEEHM